MPVWLLHVPFAYSCGPMHLSGQVMFAQRLVSVAVSFCVLFVVLSVCGFSLILKLRLRCVVFEKFAVVFAKMSVIE